MVQPNSVRLGKGKRKGSVKKEKGEGGEFKLKSSLE